MTKILFLSRKRGFGHKKRDDLIAEQLAALDKSLEIVRSGTVSGEKPGLVISDERLDVLAEARAKKIPSVLITNWFPAKAWRSRAGKPSYKTFNKAGLIIFTDHPKVAAAPPFIRPPVFFSGPIIDKARAPRGKRKKKKGPRRILVTAGKTEPVDREFFETAARAFRMMRTKAGMTVLAGGFKGRLSKSAPRGVKIEKYLPDASARYAEYDLVITRGGHTTLWELAFHGVPSISIPRPFYANPCNLGYAMNMEKLGTTKAIPQGFITASSLAYYMDNILSGRTKLRKADPALFGGDASRKAALAILRYFRAGRR